MIDIDRVFAAILFQDLFPLHCSKRSAARCTKQVYLFSPQVTFVTSYKKLLMIYFVQVTFKSRFTVGKVDKVLLRAARCAKCSFFSIIATSVGDSSAWIISASIGDSSAWIISASIGDSSTWIMSSASAAAPR